MLNALDVFVQAIIAVIALIALVASVVALIPAFVGLSHSRTANNAASGANVLALQANQIAVNAHDLSRRTEARVTEPYDVEWTIGWVDEHHLFIANQGLDAAHNVRYRIGSPGGIARRLGPLVVEPWTDFTVASDVALTQASLAASTVQLRIVWTSPAGTPHSSSIDVAGRDVFRHRRAVG